MKSKNIINLSDKSLDESNSHGLTISVNSTDVEQTPPNKEVVTAAKSGSNKDELLKKSKFNFKFREKWKNLPKFKKFLIISGVLLLIVAPTFGLYLYQTLIRNVQITENLVRLQSHYLPPSKNIKFNALAGISLAEVREPEQPKTAESPLNGIRLSESELAKFKKRAPIAIMIDNHSDARLQSGISQADIVYEALVESSITRYMPIFWSNEVEKVGPMRSARNYYLEWLLPYDPIFLHDGCAESDDPQVDACGNIFKYGIYDLATYGAWRVNTDGRYAPHNEYTSLVTAWERAENDNVIFPPNFTSWKFKKDLSINERGNQDRVNVIFDTNGLNGQTYNVSWSYNKETNLYTRSIGGQVDIDENSGQPISVKTVIIEKAITQPTFDEKGHIKITTTGEGDATIIQDGKEINGKWKRFNRKERTKYYDSSGAEIALNRGLIWISSISSAQGHLDIINR